MKSLAGAGTILTFGTITSVADTSGAGTPVSPDDIELPYPNTDVYHVDDSVKAVTPHYELLTLDKDAVRSHIKAANLRESDLNATLDFLVDMWQQYPVVKEREGNDIVFTLEETGRSVGRIATSATKDTGVNVTFADAAAALAAGAQAKSDAASDISVQYYRAGHRRQVNRACEQLGISDSDRIDIKESADDPDDYGCFCEADDYLGLPNWTPQEVVDAFETALDFIVRHYSQYYDPNVSVTYLGQTLNLPNVGTAPQAGQIQMDRAKSNTGYTRRQYLGYSTHYVADMSQPLHTGMGLEQAGVTFDDPNHIGNSKKWLHSGYEGFVYDSWNDGLKSEFESDSVYYYPINSTKQAIKDMATYSSQYSYDIYHRIFNEGVGDHTQWSSSTRNFLYEKAANCMNKNGLYTRGFLKELY